MTHAANTRPIETAQMLLLGAIWGASFLFMRMGASEFGPFALIQIRLGVASAVLLTLAVAQGKARDLLREPWKMAVVGLTNSAIPFTLFAFATLTLSAGIASVLNATAPLFGALIAVVVLRQPLTPLKWFGLIIGFAGVCVLLSSKLHLSGSAVSVVACLVAAFLYGVAAHFSKRQLSHVSPIVVAASSQTIAAIVLLPFSWLTWPAVTPSLSSWLAAIALGVLCTGVALAIYFQLLQSIGATRAMSIAYLVPLFGILWGVLFLGETLTLPFLHQ